ncbi:ATP-binding protein (plasmid) [Kitasatospora sp. CMC57]|uniref:ATP-binding protein n=1 Tax=Kitasatospora sp. CMC57 TaxID=3231513 RepID=A0AB33K5J5_9ACTN
MDHSDRGAHLELASGPEAPRQGREFTRLWLALHHPKPPPATIDDIILVTSELVTNAVRHGGERITLRLHQQEAGCRVEVHDSGTNTLGPTPGCCTDDAENGRGLAIVSELSILGQSRNGGGTTAWADLTW